MVALFLAAVLAQTVAACPAGSYPAQLIGVSGRTYPGAITGYLVCRRAAVNVAPTSPPIAPTRTRTATPRPAPTALPTIVPPAPGEPVPFPTPRSMTLGAWYAGDGATDARALAVLPGERFTWSRVRLFVTSRAPWDFAWLDAAIAQHEAAERLTLVEWWYWPDGQRHPSGGDCSTGMLGDYAALADALARRYAGRVEAWQPENEPDACGVPEDTADRLAVAYAAIKRADPSAVVVAPGLAYDNFRPDDAPPGYPPMAGRFRYSTLARMLARLSAWGCYPCADAWAVHRYEGFTYWPTLAHKGADVRRVLAGGGVAFPRLWLTEYGARAAGGEASQAAALVRLTGEARAAGFEVAVVYSAIDQAGQDFGLVTVDGRARAAVRALMDMPR